MSEVFRSIISETVACPIHGPAHCTINAYGFRKIKDSERGKQVDIKLRFAKFFCKKCKKYHQQNPDYLAEPGCSYSRKLMKAAMDIMKSGMRTYLQTQGDIEREYGVRIPITTLHDWKKHPFYKKVRESL